MQPYIAPAEVVSPKRQWTLVSVLWDRGEGDAALALGRWEGEPVLAMRWNGGKGNPIGNPQSRGLPTWFVIPREFQESVLMGLNKIAPEKVVRAQEFFIDAIVLANTIAIPEQRKAIQDAVLQGIGSRIKSETWRAKIFEPQMSPEYIIQLQGPNGYNWERKFFGPVEQTAEFIKQTVHQATHSSITHN